MGRVPVETLVQAMRQWGIGTWVCVIGTAGELATVILLVPAFGSKDGSWVAGVFAIALLIYAPAALAAIFICALDGHLGSRRWGWFVGLLFASLFVLPSYTRLRLNRPR